MKLTKNRIVRLILGKLTMVATVARSSLVRTVLLCSMAAYAAFSITVKVYDPALEKQLKGFLAINSYYLGCLHAMQYNGISKQAMGYRCQRLTEHYDREMMQILGAKNE